MSRCFAISTFGQCVVTAIFVPYLSIDRSPMTGLMSKVFLVGYTQAKIGVIIIARLVLESVD